MADTKFSALTALTSAASASTDVVPIVDVSVPASMKMTLAELALAVVNYGAIATDAELAAGLATKQDASTAATDAEVTAAVALKADLNQTLNAQTGTTYTLALTDNGKMVTLANAAAVTLTVPLNATVAFPVGARVDAAQTGAGLVTVAPTAGVTLNATPGLKCRAQYSGISLLKLATDTWLVVGDLSA